MKEGASDCLWICMSTEVYSSEMETASTGSYFSNLADAFFALHLLKNNIWYVILFISQIKILKGHCLTNFITKTTLK